MSDTSTLGFLEAARHLGVPVRVLRRAIRSGQIPAPHQMTATSKLSAEWLAKVEATVETPGHALRRTVPQKVPAFARYEGTSVWRQYPGRPREYARFRAAAAKAHHPA